MSVFAYISHIYKTLNDASALRPGLLAQTSPVKTQKFYNKRKLIAVV